MDNKEYARILSEIGVLRQIRGDNAFKIRAYENGARAIENLSEPIENLMDEGDITKIEGIGKSIAREVEALRETGVSPAHAELLEQLDPGLLDVMKVQGLGPKRIKLLYDKLGVSNLDLLRQAAQSGKIAELEGMGAKTQEKILHELERLEETSGRTPLPAARAMAVAIRDQLAKVEGVTQLEVAGSIRRGRETVGDIDIVVASSDGHMAIFDKFVSLPEVGEVLVRGDTKTSARLRSGIQVDVRVVTPTQFGAALHYFTGSKEHHVKLRTRAKKMGLKINEYGVFPRESDQPVASQTEEELYQVLGLDFIPPEIREGTDEIDRAENHTLPALIELGQVRGDIHMHTVETDGRGTIEDMVKAAQALGYDYIAITDHSQAVAVANGMDPDRFAQHIERIRDVDAATDNFTVMPGIEVDILKDGALDMTHDLLKNCDWVVGSIHSHFNLKPDEMTRRLIEAIQTGLLSCIGHPTGRILGGRDGYDFDFDAVLAACAAKGVALEINGSTGRLDLNAELAHRAKTHGVKLVLGSDAHSTRGLDDMFFAVQQARRAGLTAGDVLNTQSAAALKAIRA
ncbi:MAG: DNA polymerase/3'-5' exonuclease PolX [bacterium]